MPPAAESTPVLDQLRPEEQARVLGQLLDAHPALRAEAEDHATTLLDRVSAADVTTAVTAQLGAIPLDQLAARAGRVPGGYVEPDEAAHELVMEILASFEADLHRCIDLGLSSAAHARLLGLLDGLYRSRAPRDGTVLAYAGPDTVVEHAIWLVEEAGRAGLEVDDQELLERCPDWDLGATGPGTA